MSKHRISDLTSRDLDAAVHMARGRCVALYEGERVALRVDSMPAEGLNVAPVPAYSSEGRTAACRHEVEQRFGLFVDLPDPPAPHVPIAEPITSPTDLNAHDVKVALLLLAERLGVELWRVDDVLEVRDK
jgi:hypothetical protein